VDSHFTGVSLGATVTGSRSWAHELEVSLDDTGIAVSGPGTQPSALPWSAVKHFAPGFTLAFPDGRPATEFELTLPDRSLSFLVPAEQLPASGVAELVRFAIEKSKEAQRSAAPGTAGADTAGQVASGTAVPGIPAPPPSPSSVPLGYSVPGPRPRAAAYQHQGFSEPAYKVPTPKAPAAKKKRRRGMLVGAGGAVVAAAVAVVVILAIGGSPASRVVATTRTTRPGRAKPTTTTTSPAPAKELPGPPMSLSPASAINEVLVRGSDLHGWSVNSSYLGGQEQPGAGAAQSAENVGSPFGPSEVAVVEPSYEQLQQCSGLALDHLQLWTQNFYAGGPPTYASNSYQPNNVNASQYFETPQIYSVASEVATTSVQAQDLAAMAAPSFTGCLQGFFVSYLRSIEGQDGANVDNLTLVQVPVTTTPGVETLEWELNANLISGGDSTPIRQHLVILGAGRLEQFLVSIDSVDQPIPSATWKNVIRLVQHRMEVLASEK
jgi:hypothetical protein